MTLMNIVYRPTSSYMCLAILELPNEKRTKRRPAHPSEPGKLDSHTQQEAGGPWRVAVFVEETMAMDVKLVMGLALPCLSQTPQERIREGSQHRSRVVNKYDSGNRSHAQPKGTNWISSAPAKEQKKEQSATPTS